MQRRLTWLSEPQGVAWAPADRTEFRGGGDLQVVLPDLVGFAVHRIVLTSVVDMHMLASIHESMQ